MNTYTLWIENSARDELRQAPGNMRQRLKRAIAGLAHDPRPAHSRAITAPEGIALELRRIRLDKWRVVYAIDEGEQSIGVYAVRRRPPYNYEDLTALLADLK